MTDKTAALLSDPHPSAHIVFPYAEESNLADAVGLFTSAGIMEGDAVLLVSTKEHRDAIEQYLLNIGFDVPQLAREGRILAFDACAILVNVFQNDIVDPGTFRELISKMIESARKHAPSGRVRVYGEMVNVLCNNDRVDAAAELEGLWNAVIEAHNVPLLCSYSLSMLPAHTAGTLPARLVAAHSHTLPA